MDPAATKERLRSLFEGMERVGFKAVPDSIRQIVRPDLAVRVERASTSLAVDASVTELKKQGVYTAQGLRELLQRNERNKKELVEGLFRERSLNLLVGDSNLGKTPLAVLVGISIAAGLPVFGRQVQQGPVLYCDAESDQATFLDMMDEVAAFLGLQRSPDEFKVWSPNWETTTNRGELNSGWNAKLKSRVRLVSPRLVIVDPLRMFWPKAETGNEEVAVMVESLRDITKDTGTSWLILHHRRKASYVSPAADLVENPHAWFQETAGALALVNQSDTRLGIIPHPRQGDVLVAGIMRGSAPLPPLDLARVFNDDGRPVGYRLLSGVEHLSLDYQALFNRLPSSFRFKDVRAAIGGNSDSNATLFLRTTCSMRLLQKVGNLYTKTAAPAERVERVE